MRPHAHRPLTRTLPALLLLLASTSAADARPPLTPFALSGQQAPSMPPGFTMDKFGAGIISSAGHLSFSATIFDPQGTSLGRAFIAGPPGDPRIVLLTGEPVPGVEGATLNGWSSVRLNAAGVVASQLDFTSPGGASSSAILTSSSGGLSLIASDGAQAPDLAPGVLLSIQSAGYPRLTLGDGGHAYFNTRLTGPGVTQFNDTAIFTAAGGQTRLIAREGMTHPDFGPDRVLGNLSFIKVVAPRVNAHGAAAFFSFITGAGLPVESAMFITDVAGLRIAARSGQPIHVPDVPDARLGSFLHPIFDGLINNAGQVAFGASLLRENGDSLGPAIVIAQPGGGLTVAARSGSPVVNAPGLQLGGQYQHLRFGGAGNAAFYANATDADGALRRGLFIAHGGEVRSVALLDQPPGSVPDGYTLGYVVFDSMATNARGQLLFLGSATLPGPNPPPLTGLWAFDPIAGLFPVALEGDLIDLAPGDARTVSQLQIVYQPMEGNTGGQDGFAGNLNDSGQVIFRASFTDGTSAMITTTIPAPSALTLLALAGIAAPRRRRRSPAPAQAPRPDPAPHQTMTTPHAHRAVPVAIAALTALSALPSADARPPLTIIARTGQQIPDAPPGTVFDNLGVGLITNSGHIGFTAGTRFYIGPPGGTTAELRSAVGSGDPAPGIDIPGTFLSLPLANRVNARGELATARLTRDLNGNPSGSGIWMGAPGALGLVAYSGDQAPDLPQGVQYDLNSSLSERLTLSDSGAAVFASRLVGPGVEPSNGTAIFAGTPGQVHLIARMGDSVPALGPGVNLGEFYLHGYIGPRVNASGSLTFLSSLSGPGVEPGADTAVLVATASGIVPIARSGGPVSVPGVPDATLSFTSVLTPTPMINNAGQVAFPARVAGTGTPPGGTAALILADSAGPVSVARVGDAAPGAPEGWQFIGSHFRNVRLNGAGQVLFSNTIGVPGTPGQNAMAAYIGAPGDLRLVARTGGPAPGLPDGATMTGITFESMVTNARGQVAFMGSAQYPTPAGTSFVGGVWAFDPIDGLFPVVLSGDLIEVVPGDTRTVASAAIAWNFQLGNSGGQDGLAGNLNDLGQMILNARFTDGTSAIITTTIPAPSAGVLLVITTALVAHRRHRRIG